MATEPPDEAVEAATRAISATIGQFDLDGPKHPTIHELAAAVAVAAYPPIAVQVERDTREKIAAEIEHARTDTEDEYFGCLDHAARIARGVAGGGQDAAT